MRPAEAELAEVKRELADLDRRIERQRKALERLHGRQGATAVAQASLRLLELNRAFVEAHITLLMDGEEPLAEINSQA